MNAFFRASFFCHGICGLSVHLEKYSNQRIQLGRHLHRVKGDARGAVGWMGRNPSGRATVSRELLGLLGDTHLHPESIKRTQ